MLIACPSCDSTYAIDSERVGAAGRTVRCAACRMTWFVAPDPEPTATAEPYDEPGGSNETFDAEAAAAWATESEPQDASEPEPISVEARTARAEASPPAETIEPTSKGKSRKERAPKRTDVATFAPRAGLLLALLTFGVALTVVFARGPIVRHWPETARLYAAVGAPVNLVGLDLKGVRSELVISGADAVLVVEGDIVNAASREMSVPRIEIAVRGPSGEALYTWTNEPPRRTLGPAETARFSAKLASPPAEGRQVLVRFAAASDGTPVAAKDH
jgi:predicted Zn finger-like uncharacterized protein